MKKLSLFCAGIWCTCVLAAQPSFQTSLEAGISLPLNSNDVNAAHAGKAIHFGNHMDYTFGGAAVRFGLGAYIGYINSIGTDNSYKQEAQAIAEKYRLSSSSLVFNSSPFKSTQLLLGPVASFGSDKMHVNVWAKGGYGLNEPGRYSVVYKENGAVNNIYINQGGENKNGLAYNMGAGIVYALSPYVGLKMSAGYFTTQTDQVNYNFDREKGTAPVYYTAANQFIQASAGLQFTIGNPSAARTVYKSKSNVKNNRSMNPDLSNQEQTVIRIKTKSNIKNDRMANTSNNNAGTDAANDGDSLFFSPEKIELRSRINDAGANRTQLQSVNNYLTGFVYQTAQGAVISQCGSNAMPGDPVPGIDVRLRQAGAATNDVLTTRTNRDGSFAFNNISPGIYSADAGKDKMDLIVKGDKESAFKTLDMYDGSCGNTKENFIINADDKTYVEVISARETSSGMATGRVLPTVNKFNTDETSIQKSIVSPRDAASGLPTGKRMHKPYRVADTDFEVNWNNIIKEDGKLYAEVITAREASSGMAAGRSVVVTGDLDGDGIAENGVIAPRDAASGLATGKRMHKPFVITKELNANGDEELLAQEIAIDEQGVHRSIVSPRDAASGLPTGKRMHKPFVITKELNANGEEELVVQEIAIDESGVHRSIVSPRDAASGLPTGKRMHKPFVITKELDRVTVDIDEDDEANVADRDAASGLATGKRMHKPMVITKELDQKSYEVISPRDAASGLPTGKRMHKPYVIRIDPNDDSYEILSPRDAASGLPTGKRMHKPFVITKEMSFTDDGDEVVTYRIVRKDLDSDNDSVEKMAITEQGIPRNKGHKKGIITGKDNDKGIYAEEETATGRWLSKKGYDAYQSWEANDMEQDVVSNPLYQSDGNSGTNPLYEAKSDLRVMGSNGKEHHVFIPENLLVAPAGQTGLAAGNEYTVGPVKWMSPESLSARKGITEKGIKKNETEIKGIVSERKGWDGSVKGNGKNTNTTDADNVARKGWDGTVKGSSKITTTDADNAARKGWDGTVKGGSKNINTSEDNLGSQAVIKSISRVRCANGVCSVEAIVVADGVEYEAVVSGVLKTKHDTVKNSVGNIR